MLKLSISLIYDILLNHWDATHIVHQTLLHIKDSWNLSHNKCISFYNNVLTQKYVHYIKNYGDCCVMVIKYIFMYIFNKFIWNYICEILEQKTNNDNNSVVVNNDHDDDLTNYIMDDTELLKKELQDIQKILHNLDVLEQRTFKKIN